MPKINRDQPIQDISSEVAAIEEFLRDNRKLNPAEALAVLASTLGYFGGAWVDERKWNQIVELATSAYRASISIARR